MACTLRRAVPTDASALIACVDAAYAGYTARGIDLPPVSDGISDDIRDNWVLVATKDRHVLGCVIAAFEGETAHLKNIAVRPDQSGRGIGRALLKAATDAARDAGHCTMLLTTHIDMPDNVALYRHLGWQVSGQTGHKVYMARHLADLTD